MRFKKLEGSPKGKAQIGQYLLAVGRGRYKQNGYLLFDKGLVDLYEHLKGNNCLGEEIIKLMLEYQHVQISSHG